MLALTFRQVASNTAPNRKCVRRHAPSCTAPKSYVRWGLKAGLRSALAWYSPEHMLTHRRLAKNSGGWDTLPIISLAAHALQIPDISEPDSLALTLSS